MNILEQLADHARERVREAKRRMPEETVRTQALALPKGSFALETALRKPGLSFICECKKASPSKGLIAEDFPYLRIAREYEAAGADAVSVPYMIYEAKLLGASAVLLICSILEQGQLEE